MVLMINTVRFIGRLFGLMLGGRWWPHYKNTQKDIAMLTPKIANAIEALVDALREESPDQMTTFHLFVNWEEQVIKTHERTPEQLNAAGISMRNLRGDFIK